MHPTLRQVWGALPLAALACGHASGDGDANGGSGPERIAVVGGPCDGCALELDTLAVLGSLADPIAIRHDAATRDCTVTRGPGGGFLVSGLIGGGEVARFGADGAFRGTFGRRGEGPGELGAQLAVAGLPSDSILVLDRSQARAGIYDASGDFSRSFPIPPSFRTWTRRADGSLVFARDPSTAGDSVFTVVRRDGTAGRTIARPEAGRHPVPVDSWIVTAAADGGLWVASIWEYRIFHLDADGRADRVLERDADWFPSGGRFEDGMPVTVRPPPVLVFIREPRPGLLTVVSVVPDGAWEPDVPLTPSYVWARRAFDARVEVIDLASREVVGSVVRDDWLGAACDGDLLYSVEEGQDLALRLRVVRPTLSRRGTAPE